MPYAQTTPVVTRRRIDGRNYYFVSFSETGAAPTDKWTVTRLPYVGQIVRFQATLTAGTGTTIAPAVGRKATFTVGTKDVNTQDHINSYAAAVTINDVGPVGYHDAVAAAAETTATLTGYSTPNNPAADHTIYTEFVVLEGATP